MEEKRYTEAEAEAMVNAKLEERMKVEKIINEVEYKQRKEAAKKAILSIENPVQRTKAIEDNIELFRS